MRSIDLYLDDIVTSIDEINGLVGEMDSFAEFVNDNRTRLSVRMLLIDIGEAASRLPRTLRSSYPQIEWIDLIAFRNILTHEYFGLDWDVIWHAVKLNLPPLRETVIQMIADNEVHSSEQSS